jgi:hypothetical protein
LQRKKERWRKTRDISRNGITKERRKEIRADGRKKETRKTKRGETET